MSRRAERYTLLSVFVVMAMLQIALATRQSLWGDEIFSLAIATGHSLEHPAAGADAAKGDFVEPPGPVHPEDLQRYLKHDSPPAGPARVVRAAFLSDTSPPLYYLLLYVWTLLLGTHDMVVRLFSVAWSLACFPLLANVARRVGGRRAVLPACILFALSPLGIYFATEARMYSLLLFCVLLTVWASLALQQLGKGSLLQLAWIAASAAGFLTHYFFLFPWGATVLFLFLQPGRFKRWRLVCCIVVTGLLIIPWYMNVPDSFERWRVTSGWLHLRPKGYHAVRATRNHLVQFYSSGGSGLWPYHRWSTHAALASFAVIFGLMAWRLRWRIFEGRRLLVWLWFVAACVTPSILDILSHTYLANNPRYVMAGLPAAYLLAAIALAGMQKSLRFLMLALIALTWIPPLASIYGLRARNSQPLWELARVLRSTALPSDLILVHSIPSGVLGVARYTSAPLEMASWIQPLGNRRVPESVEALAAGHQRIFYVQVHMLGEPRPEEDWLRANAVASEQVRLEEIRVTEFRPKNGGKF